MVITRNDGRAFNQVRPLTIIYDPFGYADASVLFSIGNTKVFVSVSIKESVPRFLKGQKIGWLTAEYAMLPTSTNRRSVRDGSQSQKNARGVEISRLIGRSLRSVVSLNDFGERSILVDCDVLQADGGTRTACITAANIALSLAEKRWLQSGKINSSFIKKEIAAISAGIVNGQICLDLSQVEDNRAEADFNFVLTRSGDIVEVQGTAEKCPAAWEDFEHLKKLALHGVEQLFEAQDCEMIEKDSGINKNIKSSIFSLGNRN